MRIMAPGTDVHSRHRRCFRPSQRRLDSTPAAVAMVLDLVACLAVGTREREILRILRSEDPYSRQKLEKDTSIHEPVHVGRVRQMNRSMWVASGRGRGRRGRLHANGMLRMVWLVVPVLHCLL